MVLSIVSEEPRAAFLGSYPPRECGIATFTRDLTAAVASSSTGPLRIAAIEEPGSSRSYGGEVAWRLRQDDASSYRRLAAELNAADVDVLCVQHEYGLFGGEAGALLLDLVEDLDIPVVTTLHTTLGNPGPEVRKVTRELCARSAATVVLARSAVPLLRDVYGVDPSSVHFVPHGIPSVPRVRGARRRAKAAFGLGKRTLLSTFGLIGPGKGIENVIRALPDVVRRHPDALYLVLGQTHPGQRRQAGEQYRESLQALVAELGLREHVRFEDRYLSQAELVQWLLATDVYLMPYLDPEQIVSGTLAYAVGCGKAVVATKFRYAKELLSDGVGELVDFRDPQGIRAALLRYLGDRAALAEAERRAWASSRGMQWHAVARGYRDLFAEVTVRQRQRQIA